MRILCLVLVVLCAASVSAIGISPPSAKLDFEPGKTYTIDARITNYNDFPIEVEVRTEGEFADAFTYKEPIRIKPLDSTYLTLMFTMPQSLTRPGLHTNYIYFKEKFIDKSQGTFTVRTEVGMKVMVWQPYPGSYAEIVASAGSVPEGEDTVAKVHISNLGQEAIASGKASVRVVAADGTLMDVLSFLNIELAGNSDADYADAIRSAGYKPGKYRLEARLDYNDKVATQNSSFKIGTQDIDITAAEGPLYLDKPANKFAIHIESLWNQPLENVYGVFELGSGKTTTASVTLAPFGADALTGYWETDRTVPVGDALAHVTVFFGNESKEALLPITVYNETPREPTVEEPAVVLSLADLVFIVLALIIVAGIVLFAVAKHRKHEPEPPRAP